MPERALTDEQREAVLAGGAVAVRAAAGSGKTTVLAERFVHLLRPRSEGLPLPEVRRLLAITFTERAAAEMRGRIRLLVDRESRECPDEAAHWAIVQRDLLGAHISTIHAFCARVVREFPMQSGVDPDARVLDADEARRYLDARVERHLLGLAGRGHPGAVTLLHRARGLRGGHGGGAVGAMLGMLEALGRLGRDGSWLRERTRAVSPVHRLEDVRAIVEEAITIVDGKLAGKRSPKRAAFAEGWPRRREALRHLVDSVQSDLAASVRLLDDFVTELKGARLGADVAPILSRTQGRLRGTLIQAIGSLTLAAESGELADLVSDVETLLEEDKRRDAVLTFDDLVSGARDLVVQDAAVCRSLSRRFDAVLLDESQDTDAAQAELLERIASDGGPTLFVVGDEKQAIYGFRGADVGVFERLLAELPTRVTLGRNFRSVPDILAFVNAMAAAMLCPPRDAAYPSLWTRYGAEHALLPHRTASMTRPAVRVVTAAHELLRRGNPNAAARRELEARILAEVLVDLLNDPGSPMSAGGITVLLRSLREVKVYERALARRGVPYHVVGGRGFFQRQEVRDVVSLAALVADANDDTALAAVLRSPWVALGDDELGELAARGGSLRKGFEGAPEDPGDAPLQAFRRNLCVLRALRSRATVSETLVRAVEAADLDAVLLALPQGEQLVANVRKVIELARAFEQGAHGGLAEFVAWMRRREAADGDEPEATLASEEGDVVRLMTVHQAKGLEFPTVVLADLGREPRIDYEAVVIDEERGVIAAPLAGAGGHALVPAELAAHRTRALEASRAEQARLFYVACTRARDHLILLDATTPPDRLDGGSSRETWGHALWSLIGDERVREAGAAAEATMVELGEGVVMQLDPAGAWLGEGRVRSRMGRNRRRFTDEEIANRIAALEGESLGSAEVVECTPTDIAVFRACPRRWWYQSVLGVREGIDGGRRARVLGSIVHGALERWSAGTAAGVVEALGSSFDLRVSDPRMREEVRTDVARAIDWLSGRSGERVIARELGVIVALAPDVVLRGRIDAVLERGGHAVVRDYKYARPPTVTDALYAAQLGLYALALMRAGTVVDGAELLYLRPEPTLVPVPTEPMDVLAATAIDAARRMAAWRRGPGKEPPERGPVDPTACREAGCGYVSRCWVSENGRRVSARTAEA